MSVSPMVEPRVLWERAPEVRDEAEALELLARGWELYHRGRGNDAYESLLARLGVVTERVVDWALDRHPLSLGRLFENPRTVGRVSRHLVSRIYEGWRADLDSPQTPTPHLGGALRQACLRGFIPFGSEREWELRELALQGWTLPGRNPDELSKQTYRRLQAAASVASCPGVTREVLAQLLAACAPWVKENRGNAMMLTAFIHSPAADLDVWRQISEWGRNYPHLLVELAQFREARLDVCIRYRLTEAEGLHQVRQALCLDHREDARARFFRLMETEPEDALEVLEHSECTVTQGFDREEWARLLGSPYAPLRLQALALQGRQTQEGGAERPSTQGRRRASR